MIFGWNNYLKEVCLQEFLANPLKIEGVDEAVEINGSFLERKSINVRMLSKSIRFWGICRDTAESSPLYVVLTEF